MQGSLAVAGLLLGLGAAWHMYDLWIVAGAVLIGASAPFTLIFILPTNKQLLDPALDPRGAQAGDLLQRWNRLHAVRTAFSAAAFGVLLCCAAALRGRAW